MPQRRHSLFKRRSSSYYQDDNEDATADLTTTHFGDDDDDSSDDVQFHDLSIEEQRAMANFIVSDVRHGAGAAHRAGANDFLDEQDIDYDFQVDDEVEKRIQRETQADSSGDEIFLQCGVKNVKICEREVPLGCMRRILHFIGIYPHWFGSNLRLVSQEWYRLLHLEEYLWRRLGGISNDAVSSTGADSPGREGLCIDVIYRGGKRGQHERDDADTEIATHTRNRTSSPDHEGLFSVPKPFYALGYDPNEKTLTPQLFRRSPYEYLVTKIDFSRVTKFRFDYLGMDDVQSTLYALFRWDRQQNQLEELDIHYPIAFHSALPSNVIDLTNSDWDVFSDVVKCFPNLKVVRFINFQISLDHSPSFVHKTSMKGIKPDQRVQVEVMYILNEASSFFELRVLRAVEQQLVGGTDTCRYSFHEWTNYLRSEEFDLDSIRLKYFPNSISSTPKQASLMNCAIMTDFTTEEDREKFITFLHKQCGVLVQAKNVIAALHLCEDARTPLFLLENFSPTIRMDYVDHNHDGILNHAVKEWPQVDLIKELVSTFSCPVLLETAYHPFESLMSASWMQTTKILAYLVDEMVAQYESQSVEWVRGALSDSLVNVCRFVLEYDFNAVPTHSSHHNLQNHHTNIKENIVSQYISECPRQVDMGFRFVDNVSLADLLCMYAEDYELLSPHLVSYLERQPQEKVNHSFKLLSQRSNCDFAMAFLVRSGLPLPPAWCVAKILRNNPKLLRNYFKDNMPRMTSLFRDSLELEHIAQSNDDDPPLLHRVCESACLDLLEYLVELHGEDLKKHFTDVHKSTKNNVLHYVVMNDVGESESLRQDRTDTLLYLLNKLPNASGYIQQGNLDDTTPGMVTTLKRLKSELENFENEDPPDLTDIVNRRSIALCHKEIPTEIMHHIFNFVSPYPDYFRLRSVCSSLQLEIEEYYCDVVRNLDLIYRGEPNVKPFTHSGYPDYHVGPQVYLYNPFLYMRECFPVVTHLRIDFNDDLKGQLTRMIGSHTKHPMPVQNLDIHWPVWDKPKPLTRKMLLDYFEILSQLPNFKMLTLQNFPFDTHFSLGFVEKPKFDVTFRGCFSTERDVFPAWLKIEQPLSTYTEKDIIEWLDFLWKQEVIAPDLIHEFKGTQILLYAVQHNKCRLVDYLKSHGMRVDRSEIVQCYSKHEFDAAERIIQKYKEHIAAFSQEEGSIFTIACLSRAQAAHLIFLLNSWPALVNDENLTETLQSWISFNGYFSVLEHIFALRNEVVAAEKNGENINALSERMNPIGDDHKAQTPQIHSIPEASDDQLITIDGEDDEILFLDLDADESDDHSEEHSGCMTKEQVQHMLDLVFYLTLNPELDIEADKFWFNTIIQSIPDRLVNVNVPAACSEEEHNVQLTHILIAANCGELIMMLLDRKNIKCDDACIMLAAQHLTHRKCISALIEECTPTEFLLDKCADIAVQEGNDEFLAQLFTKHWNDLSNDTKRALVCKKPEHLRRWDLQSGGKMEGFVETLKDEELFKHAVSLENFPTVFESIASSGYETLFKHILNRKENVAKYLETHSAYLNNNIFHFALNPKDVSSATSCLLLMASLLKRFDHERAVALLQEKNTEGKTPMEDCRLQDLLEHTEEYIENAKFQRPKRSKKRSRSDVDTLPHRDVDDDEEHGHSRKKRRISTRSRNYEISDKKAAAPRSSAKRTPVSDEDADNGEDGAFQLDTYELSDSDEEMPDDLVDEKELEEEDMDEEDDYAAEDLIPEDDDEIVHLADSDDGEDVDDDFEFEDI